MRRLKHLTGVSGVKIGGNLSSAKCFGSGDDSDSANDFRARFTGGDDPSTTPGSPPAFSLPALTLRDAPDVGDTFGLLLSPRQRRVSGEYCIRKYVEFCVDGEEPPAPVGHCWPSECCVLGDARPPSDALRMISWMSSTMYEGLPPYERRTRGVTKRLVSSRLVQHSPMTKI